MKPEPPKLTPDKSAPLSIVLTEQQPVYKRLLASDISLKLQTREQAARVSWRIIYHWLVQQLAMRQKEKRSSA